MGKHVAQPRRTTRASQRLAPCVRLLLEALEERCLLSGTVPYGQLPLAFEVNEGQAATGIEFVARGSGYALALAPTTASLSLQGKPTGPTPGDQLLQTRLVGANPVSQVIGQDLLPSVSNYLVGDNPAGWHTNIPNYGQAVEKNVYPGVNLVYFGARGQLEYDFVVQPGANPGAIRLAIDGARSLTLDGQGDLVLQTANGAVVEKAPLVYQQIGGVRRSVAGRFVLLDHQQIGFAVGAYDASQPITIDPILSYSTFLGGSQNDSGQAIALDGSADAFITGETASTDFPTAAPFQAHSGGGFDVFVTKLNPAGTAMLYSTYIGGSGNEQGNGIAVDAAGAAYVTGYTTSTNFPTVSALQGRHGSDLGGQDAFVLKLNPSGSGLIYSTYFGGSSNDTGFGIAIDSAGSAYVTGSTSSSNFPTLSAAQQTLGGGLSDGFVTKLSPSGAAVYSTYLGGSGDDVTQGIVVESNGNVDVAGSTSSTNWSTSTTTRIGPGGSTNVLVAQLNSSGAALVRAALIGGSNIQGASALARDSFGQLYLTGFTGSSNFPTAAGFGATQPFQSTKPGLYSPFVVKLSPLNSAPQLVYSTFLGGSSEDFGTAVGINAAGDAFVGGYTTSTDFPTAGGPLQSTQPGLQSGFVAELNTSGGALLYSTFLGGTSPSGDQVNGIAVNGDVFVTGSTTSSDFPTTNALQPIIGGGSDAFVTKFAFHDWQAMDVTVSSTNQSLMLWDSFEKDVDVWSINNSLAASTGAVYGPFSAWTAVATAAGADGFNRVLFQNTNGSTALWLVRSDGMLSGAHIFAAMNGWTAQDVTVGADGNTRLLWTNSSGAIMVWSLDVHFNVTSSPVYGPISGWTARSIAAGGDGLARVLWDNVTGQTALWFLNAAGSITSSGVMGPITGWTATDIAVGPDNQTRLLWDNVNGAAVVWSVSSSFTITSSPVFGPLSGWSAARLADGGDGLVRLLWDNVNGTAALWLLNSDGSFKQAASYGPI